VWQQQPLLQTGPLLAILSVVRRLAEFSGRLFLSSLTASCQGGARHRSPFVSWRSVKENMKRLLRHWPKLDQNVGYAEV
jgi:hypothetical protein